MAVCASTTATDCWAGSSPSIVIGDRASRAGTENGWSALAGPGATARGTREPARPGSDTRARAVLITVPTTNNLGRTIGRERYAAHRTYVNPHGAARVTLPDPPDQAPRPSADDDRILAGVALDGADVGFGPRGDLDAASLATLAARRRPRQPAVAHREARQRPDIDRCPIDALQAVLLGIDVEE